MAVKRGRGRPPVYASLIASIRVHDGWVDVCEQQNRTAPSGYRQRYPDNDFRVIPQYAESTSDKPYVLQARKLRQHEKAAVNVEQPA